MFTVPRAVTEVFLQHFIYQKVEISYAINKPFPFFEGLRDKQFITERMYLESLEACQNLVPVSRVVHNILTKLEPAFDLSLLLTLFSPINLREYPGLLKIIRSFRSVGYPGRGRSRAILPDVYTVPAEVGSRVHRPRQGLLPLPQPPSSSPSVWRVSRPEAPTRHSRGIQGEAPCPTGPAVIISDVIQERRISPVTSDSSTIKTNDGEDSQEMPSSPSGSVQGEKRKRSVLATPKKRHQLKSPPKEMSIPREKRAQFTPEEVENAENLAESVDKKRRVLCRRKTPGRLSKERVLLQPLSVAEEEEEESEAEAGDHTVECGEGAQSPRQGAGKWKKKGWRSIRTQTHWGGSGPGGSGDGGSGELRASAGPEPRGRRAPENGKRVDCPALPSGWQREEVIRKSGSSAGRSDVYYFSPTGKKVRSKAELARYLRKSVDLSSFDYKTGMMMPSK